MSKKKVKNEYTPDYPKNPQALLEMLQESLAEYKDIPSDKYTDGYTQGLRFAQTLAANLVANLQTVGEGVTQCLSDLVDEQNGAPLVRREKQWQEVMDRADEILSKEITPPPT